MNINDSKYDVLIVGSGLMAAGVANRLRAANPEVTIGMIAGGPAIGSTTGKHLHDVPEQAIWERYNEKVASGIQGFYTGVAPTPEAGTTMHGAEPGMYHLASLGEDAAEMPSAAVAWNAGGMGIHWTAATPIPGGREIPTEIPAHEWDGNLAAAMDLLKVNDEPFPASAAGIAIRKVWEDRLGSASDGWRGIRDMPMAINANADGLNVRTSPSVIFPPIGAPDADEHFSLISDALATSIEHDSGHASSVQCRDINTDETFTVEADQIVVCADAIRTPQLLFASHIRPEALGRYLNEHYFLTGVVLADPARVGFDLASLRPATDQESIGDAIWAPYSDEAYPYQTHLLNTVMIDESGAPLAYGVGLEYYVPTDIQRDNRLEFSETEVDAAGLPRITVHFSYTDNDRANLAQAQLEQAEFAQQLGEFNLETDSAVLTPGSSLHFTGTVRMGTMNDGTSVCDQNGRVWDFDNLYVAGCGVVPTALACNSTLTGMTTAVRAAAAVDANLRDSESVLAR